MTTAGATQGIMVRQRVASRLLTALYREGFLDPRRLPTELQPRVATLSGRLVLDAPSPHPVDLLRFATLGDVSADAVAELSADLESAVVNLTDAAEQPGDSGPPPGMGLISWLRRRTATDPSFSTLAWAEQGSVEGHPLHPLGGVRVGFTDAERHAFAPEFRPAVDIGLVAVRRDRLHASGRPFAQVLAQHHPHETSLVDVELWDAGLDTTAYDIVPAHPWQLEHVIRPALTRLPPGTAHICSATIPARPLISVRTVAPSTPDTPHLKLPIGVRSTGAVRRLSTHATRNGPVVSALLRTIIDSDPLLREGGLGVLSEDAALHFVSSPGESFLDADLAALSRTNPETDHHLVVPVAALRSRLGHGGAPLLAEVLDEATPPSSRREAGRRFARRYAELLMVPALTLLTRYGVALELHGQNTLVALENGLPSALLARDFGSIRLHRGRLARHGLAPVLTADAPISTDDVDELRAKLLYTLGHDHLGELLPCLSDVSKVSERELWLPFRAEAERAYALLAREPDAAGDADAVLAAQWPLKSLLRMRLRGDTHVQSYVPATNPLASLAEATR